MRRLALFTLVACSSASPSRHIPVETPLVIPRFPPADAAVPDAAIVSTRGGRCSESIACAAGLECTPSQLLPGGYCTSPCDISSNDCDGVCVATARMGEVCAAKCTSDADCRVDDGYVCDPTWNACLVPNVAVIVPNAGCPAPTGRDLAFGTAEPADAAGTFEVKPSAVISDDGGEGAMFTTGPRPRPRRGDALYAMYGTAIAGLRVRASVDGGATFSAPVTALTGDRAAATVSADGTLHVVALDGSALGAFGSAMQKIDYTASSDGAATFSQPVVVSGPDELLPYYFADPAIAVDDKRKLVHVVYVRGGRDARWELVLATSRDRGATWKRITVAGDGCAIHMAPTVALDDKTGTLHVAYYDNEGGSGRFAHASCTPGPRAMKCTQHGAINSAPFAAFSTVRHGGTSIGDHASLVLDTKRRTLHAQWTQPVSEGGVVTKRIFHARAPLPK